MFVVEKELALLQIIVFAKQGIFQVIAQNSNVMECTIMKLEFVQGMVLALLLINVFVKVGGLEAIAVFPSVLEFLQIILMFAMDTEHAQTKTPVFASAIRPLDTGMCQLIVKIACQIIKEHHVMSSIVIPR